MYEEYDCCEKKSWESACISGFQGPARIGPPPELRPKIAKYTSYVNSSKYHPSAPPFYGFCYPLRK
jgi:hypothetical protein